MKLIPFLLCYLFAIPLFSQTVDSLKQQQELLIITSDQYNPQDTARIKILRSRENKHRESTVSELLIIGKNAYRKGSKNRVGRYKTFKGHWSGFHYGFVNFAHLPEYAESLELDWGHSFAMQFNLCKYSINLVPRNNFGLVTGLGLEYQRLRFNNDNISIQKSYGKLDVIHPLHEDPNINRIKRSTFKNLYLTIPLMLEVQFPARNSRRMYLSGGIMGGLRMHSKTKIVYTDQDGDKQKRKGKGNFNMVPFKADAIGRIGYRGLNVWGSYTLTNMFKSNSGVPSLHLYTVGLGATF